MISIKDELILNGIDHCYGELDALITVVDDDDQYQDELILLFLISVKLRLMLLITADVEKEMRSTT